VCRPFLSSVATNDGDQYSSVRLGFIGGIPSEAGRRSFLHFAPPHFSLSGSPELIQKCNVQLSAYKKSGRGITVENPVEISDDVKFTDELLGQERETDKRRFLLARLPEDCVRCEITVSTDGLKKSKHFYVDSESLVDEFELPPGRDSLGQPSKDSTPVFQGLELAAREYKLPGELPIASLPLQDSDTEFDESGSSRIMQLMHVRRRLSWESTKRLVPGCVPRFSESRYSLRWVFRNIEALHCLGVIEIEENMGTGISAVSALPPKIILLPVRANGHDQKGVSWTPYQSMPVGCWSPDLMQKLQRFAKPSIGVDVRVAFRRSSDIVVPPRRILLTAEDKAIDRIQELADKLEVEFTGSVPYASQLAAVFSDINLLAEHENWESGIPAGTFTTRYFDPHTLSLHQRRLEHDDRYELWECTQDERPVWRFFVVDVKNDRRLEIVDRQTARWFVRRQALPNAPIPITVNNILVPVELRLPRMLERLLILSSGELPDRCKYGERHSPFLSSERSRQFAIPSPQEAGSVNSNSKVRRCSGEFFQYYGGFRTAAWPGREPMPLLGLNTESISASGLENLYD